MINIQDNINTNNSNEISNLFDEEIVEIFGNLYIANVSNRLRELENPNDVDCKRWVWELVQNAKDSIAGNSDRTSVDIEIPISLNMMDLHLLLKILLLFFINIVMVKRRIVKVLVVLEQVFLLLIVFLKL
ncbi:hypothetical protein H8356DRAFT_1087091 [Neocallimastix lanati (nom. inval.)]|uniref:Uncharacterized protein n=1 Tax=Neocallimastix californiae TaxID=1754190 RepID=A0A1Y2D7M7_9FUNG|nr:hypothetical protein H8356DRAFT_1087091 [Neocallimastix sp. JGI-2020a]ORY54615.1 hypothetical protein LY90DRAFT_646813 [Neocallimastix californiae]|eukprot:ORY54615.1 hypothetical protein LY90DRAFT_646813 [Neocallimastix californiae]